MHDTFVADGREKLAGAEQKSNLVNVTIERRGKRSRDNWEDWCWGDVECGESEGNRCVYIWG